jgi:hypothetical protein
MYVYVVTDHNMTGKFTQTYNILLTLTTSVFQYILFINPLVLWPRMALFPKDIK